MTKLSIHERYAAANANKSKLPIPNMLYKDHPPQFISIIGPSGSGKSLLFNSIVHHFTGESLSNSSLVTFSTCIKRITLFKSSNKLLSIIDTIKVSDIVLLTINIAVGLEQLTLESLTALVSHGTSKLLVIFVGNITTQQIKIKIKNKIIKILTREYQLDIEYIDYSQSDCTKLCRALNLIKTRPVMWKSLHPHIVVDTKRDEYYYGYIRGGPIKDKTAVYMPGIGYGNIEGLERVEDVCIKEGKKRGVYASINTSKKDTKKSINKEIDKSINNELNQSINNDIKIFKDDRIRERAEIIEMEQDGTKIEPANNIIEQNSSNLEHSQVLEQSDVQQYYATHFSTNMSIQSTDMSVQSTDKLILAKNRFKNTVNHIDKFNNQFNNQLNGNILQIKKEKELEIQQDIESITKSMIPGWYCKFRITANTIIKYNSNELLIIGVCLNNERDDRLIETRILKNKWQTSDLKSNKPYYISMGWCRFQSIPIFIDDGKYMKYLRCSDGSKPASALFYGPSLPIGTGMFIFDINNHKFNILAAGNIIDSSGRTTIKKKLKLVGYPAQVMGNNAIIQSMFTSDKEVDRFINARLKCTSGLRGVLKRAVGHAGHFRATFEGRMLMTDLVFIRCYVGIEPYREIVHMMEGAEYMKERDKHRSIKVNENECINGDTIKCIDTAESINKVEIQSINKIKRENNKIKREIPFDRSNIKVINEEIEIPVPPEQRKREKERKRIEQIRKEREEEDKQNKRKKEKREEERIKERKREKNERRKELAIKSKRIKEKGRR